MGFELEGSKLWVWGLGFHGPEAEKIFEVLSSLAFSISGGNEYLHGDVGEKFGGRVGCEGCVGCVGCEECVCRVGCAGFVGCAGCV